MRMKINNDGTATLDCGRTLPLDVALALVDAVIPDAGESRFSTGRVALRCADSRRSQSAPDAGRSFKHDAQVVRTVLL